MLNKKFSALLMILLFLFSVGLHKFALYVLNNTDAFSIKKVIVNGATVSYNMEFNQALSKVTNMYNLYDLNSFSLKEELESGDFVKEVTIKKEFPFTLVIDVVERVPLARIKTSSAQYITDKEGVIVTPFNNNELVNITVQFGLGVNNNTLVDEYLQNTLNNLAEVSKEELQSVLINQNRETYFTLKNLSAQFYLEKNILSEDYIQKALKIKQKIDVSTNIKMPKIIDIYSYEDTFIGVL